MPDMPERAPSPPKHLTKSAKSKWRSISKKLHRLGILTEVDVPALALCCQAYGRWVDAEKQLGKTGMVIKTTNGNLVNSPYLNIANTAMRDCYNYLREFGMTPSSRTKVTAVDRQPKSKFAGLIAGNG
jgi:P27 family predicted phage terminase small subunit